MSTIRIRAAIYSIFLVFGLAVAGQAHANTTYLDQIDRNYIHDNPEELVEANFRKGLGFGKGFVFGKGLGILKKKRFFGPRARFRSGFTVRGGFAPRRFSPGRRIFRFN